jgi:hypothetical protein
MWSGETQTAELTRRVSGSLIRLSVCIRSFWECGQIIYEWTVVFLPPHADKSWNLFE